MPSPIVETKGAPTNPTTRAKKHAENWIKGCSEGTRAAISGHERAALVYMLKCVIDGKWGGDE